MKRITLFVQINVYINKMNVLSLINWLSLMKNLVAH